ncbi:MAG: hypothetical protein ACFFA5_04560 [Promethearchaeota archaeon]
MSEKLVDSVRKSYRMYKNLLYVGFSLIFVISVASVIFTFGQVGMLGQPTFAQQKELVDAGRSSENLAFTSAFYFVSPFVALELGLIVIGVSICIVTFSYVEPEMSQFITDEVKALGFGIQRKLFRRYTIEIPEGRIFLKFIPHNSNSSEWCLLKLESPSLLNGKKAKNGLEEIVFRHMLTIREDKISVTCNFTELFFKLLLMTKALSEIKSILEK